MRGKMVVRENDLGKLVVVSKLREKRRQVDLDILAVVLFVAFLAVLFVTGFLCNYYF